MKLSLRLTAVAAVIGAQMISAEAQRQQVVTPIPTGDPAIHIIPLGSPLKFGGANAPDTYSASTTFSSTPVVVDNGAVRIWQEQVATGTNGEWEIFHLQTINGGPLANNLGGNWNIVMEYNLSAPVSFDASVSQWAVNGVPVSGLSNFGSLCCAATSNPILPGAAYYNFGANILLPAGTQTNWQQIFVQPYSFANSGGVPTATANEFTFALHFTLQPPAAPTIAGVISASAFAAYPTIAPGSWIEIYGANFAVGAQGWAAGDFNGVNAPTKLGGVSVSINGKAAFVDYVSSTQVNAQVPAGVSTGPQALVVTTPTASSASFTVTVDAIKPGVLAPANFKIGATQYAVALFPDSVTYVLPPGAIAGLPSRRAKPGDTITFYGVGFGAVNPGIQPGQIASQLNTLAAQFAISFGSAQAQVTYDGLVPNFVGLYQFNAVVPSVAPSDAVAVTFTLNGVNVQQNLSIAVGN